MCSLSSAFRGSEILTVLNPGSDVALAVRVPSEQ